MEAKQIGCLVEASPCSIGYSGLTALNDHVPDSPDPNRKVPDSPDPNRKGLGLRSSVRGSNAAVFPTKADVRLLLQPANSACTAGAAADGGFEDRYPLSRALRACTSNGIPGIAGATTFLNPGAQTPEQLTVGRR